jgi:hypothetical protein
MNRYIADLVVISLLYGPEKAKAQRHCIVLVHALSGDRKSLIATLYNNLFSENAKARG